MENQAYAKMFAIEKSLWWYRGRRAVCLGLLRKYLGRTTTLRILDVGCGTGLNMANLREFGQVTGVDMSTEALELCRQRGETEVFLHEAEVLPFAQESFELLTAFDVIEHIQDDRKALGEFARLLVPTGWLLIYTPALPWLYNDHDRHVQHFRRYLKGDLDKKLVQAGFEVVFSSYTNFFMLPVVLLARVYYALSKTHHPEMEMTPEPFNSIFTKVCRWEARFFPKFKLPLGLSLVALVRKNSK